MGDNLYIHGGRSVPTQDYLARDCVVGNAIASIVKDSHGRWTKEFVNLYAAQKLKLLNWAQPTAQKIIKIAQEQDELAGDGTSTVVIFAAELLKNANRLMHTHRDNMITVPKILKAYDGASTAACKFVKEQLSKEATTNNFQNVIYTMMKTKLVQGDADLFSKFVNEVWTRHTSRLEKDYTNVSLLEFAGRQSNTSKLVDGYVMECDIAEHLTIEKTTKVICFGGDFIGCRVNYHDEQNVVDDYKQMDANRAKIEEKFTLERIHQMQMDGVKVIFCSGKTSSSCRQMIEEAGMIAIDNVSKENLKQIVDFTGESSRLLHFLENYKTEYTGNAISIVRDDSFGTNMIIINNPRKMNQLSICICGPDSNYCGEVTNLLRKSFKVMEHVRLEGFIDGGGKSEEKIAAHLKEFVNQEQQETTTQDIMSAFADSLLCVPATLLKNGVVESNKQEASFNPLDAAFVKITAISLATKTINEILRPNLYSASKKHSISSSPKTPIAPIATTAPPSTPIRKNLGMNMRRLNPYPLKSVDLLRRKLPFDAVPSSSIIVTEKSNDKTETSVKMEVAASVKEEQSTSSKRDEVNNDSSIDLGRQMQLQSNVFFCDHCDAIFVDKKDCTAHENDCKLDYDQNIQDRQFSCTKCEKQFFDRSELRVHYIAHVEIKPFSCGICKKSFYKKIDVMHHHMTEHK